MRPTSTLVYRVKRLAEEGKTLEEIHEVEEVCREQLRSVLNRSGIDYLFFCKEGAHKAKASNRQKGLQHCQDCHSGYLQRRASVKKQDQTAQTVPEVVRLTNKDDHLWNDDQTRLGGGLVNWCLQEAYQYE